jgi:branched-chain amino acid aminotransferase
MIWVHGRIEPETELAISVADRTFEHGLGLFETLRTWNGYPTLLTRHLARLARSAEQLGLPLDPTALPTSDDVHELLRADGVPGDALLRITMTGGLSAGHGAVVWMRTGPLPKAVREAGADIGGFWQVSHDDPIARHKCLNYWRRRLAYEQGIGLGLDECLSTTAAGEIWEGSRTNLFWVVGKSLETPVLDGPLVPGIMRALVLERAEPIGLNTVEGRWPRDRLHEADEVFLTNAVRGVVPVRRLFLLDAGVEPSERSPRLLNKWPARGPWTNRLANDLNRWLSKEGALP